MRSKCQDLHPGWCGSNIRAQCPRCDGTGDGRLETLPCQSTWPGPLSQGSQASQFSGKEVVSKNGSCFRDPSCLFTVTPHHYTLLGCQSHMLAKPPLSDGPEAGRAKAAGKPALAELWPRLGARGHQDARSGKMPLKAARAEGHRQEERKGNASKDLGRQRSKSTGGSESWEPRSGSIPPAL